MWLKLAPIYKDLLFIPSLLKLFEIILLITPKQSNKSWVGLIQKIIKFYIIMTINITHILSNVVRISSNIEKTTIFSQFFNILKNIFAYNFKTVITINLGLVSFER